MTYLLWLSLYSGMHLNEIQNLLKKLYTIMSFNSVTVA